jgi:O-antigen/teichoic acid export membrane protein
MSRLRLYLQGVACTYISLAASVIYTLVSVPLALKFLRNSEFGLWGLLTQYVSYLWLVDAGMSPSIGRLLIERKDHRDDGSYGSLIITGFLVGLAQGAIVLLVGLTLPEALSRLSKIPPELNAAFCSLVRWQSVITATMFATRIFRNVLYAHQRNDLINLTQAASSMAGLATLWAVLHWHGGILSILWSNAAALLLLALVTAGSCVWLGVLPARGAWGRSSWSAFKELFRYGRDVFVVQVGGVLIMAVQPIIISRNLGLDAVAAWSVGTKAFFLLFSLIYQAFDVSAPAFSEMMVRGENQRLRGRYLHIVSVSLTLSGAAAVIYTACNSHFVAVWTHGRIPWPAVNDVWLGLWMIVAVLVHANAAFVILTKRIAAMRYVYLLEGAAFVALASLLTSRGGLPAMIGCSLVCSAGFSGGYTLWRVRQYFQFRASELRRAWLAPLLRIVAVAGPVALAIWWLTARLAGLPRLISCAASVGLVCGILFYRWGIPAGLRAELLGRLRSRLA